MTLTRKLSELESNQLECNRLARGERIAVMRARDGDNCMHPDCGKLLDFDIKQGPWEVTEDHHYPQSKAYEAGWTYEQVWDLNNLRLFHKKCNAAKGNLIPNEDGTLPAKSVRTFRYRRDTRAQRPEICTACTAGRDLGPDEICAACGSGPQPLRWPRWAKVASKDCLHDGTFWCWACGSGVVPMRPAIETILLGGEGGDTD